ncbi:hypothetical protein [Sphingomonas faeni]|uniref:hypothetical protein n=1 Tax=Sphingomonas faeni TaxID=185950 RepID=UPI003593F81C
MGAAIKVASVAGVFGMGSSAVHIASKGSLVTRTKSLARVLVSKIWVDAAASANVEFSNRCHELNRSMWTVKVPPRRRLGLRGNGSRDEALP